MHLKNKTLKIKIMKTLKRLNKKGGKKRQIMNYRDNITILEFVKEYQQDVIAELEYLTGLNISQKTLPKYLVDEIYKKKIILKNNS